MIIDAHCHTWLMAPEKYPWHPVGGYLPDTEAPVDLLLNRMDSAGVDQAVLVQPTPYGWNNAYLLDAARACPERLKTVCLVDPHSPESPAKLERLVREQGVSGVRFNWNLDPSFAWSSNAEHGQIWSLAEELGIPVCLQISRLQLGAVKEMAANYSQVRIVIDHFGHPQPGSREDGRVFKQFLALSEYPQCYAKLSGLYYFSRLEAPYRDTWPLIRATVQAFGAQRCLWGSDFPFILERWSYTDWLQLLQNRLEFTPVELEYILGQTALELWW